MILREMIDGVAKTSIAEPVFEESYDLVVVGLGTAGAISLITAGREGLKVLGVEQLYVLFVIITLEQRAVCTRRWMRRSRNFEKELSFMVEVGEILVHWLWTGKHGNVALR